MTLKMTGVEPMSPIPAPRMESRFLKILRMKAKSRL
jgi:hypothetical protein